jgi:hypothetical protein
VTRSFREEDRQRVLAALTRVDGDRCQVAVLVLGTDGASDLARIEHLADAAAVDFRDVLYWAEYSPDRLDYPAALSRLGLSRPYPSEGRTADQASIRKCTSSCDGILSDGAADAALLPQAKSYLRATRRGPIRSANASMSAALTHSSEGRCIS